MLLIMACWDGKINIFKDKQPKDKYLKFNNFSSKIHQSQGDNEEILLIII